MDKKDWTPEELELKETLNKLYENDTRMPSKPLDLSFMNEAAEKKSGKKRINFKYVAAAVILIAASSFFTAVFMSNDYASAVQDKIERKVFEMKHGVVVATDEEFAEEGETVWEITDFEVAKKAKELVPELPIPGYVPEGYEFEKLVLNLYEDCSFYANFHYQKKDNLLIINCQYINNNFNANVYTQNKVLEYNDRLISIIEDPISHTTSVAIILKNILINLSTSDSTINDTTLIQIGKQLQ